MNARRRPAALLGAGLALALPLALVGSASAAPRPAVALAPVPGGSYNGYSSGDIVYANAVNAAPGDLAKASTGQSAAGVASPSGTLTTSDQMQQPLLTKPTAGKTAYGHGSGLNIGIGGSLTAHPQVAESTAEATSPAPSTETKTAVNIPADPLLTANLLTSTAAANTTADGACVVGKDISNGTANLADARALSPTATTPVVNLKTASDGASRTALIQPTKADGSTVATGKSGLLSQSTLNLAPITLFAGTPAELTIKVLAPLQLSAAAGGVAGTSVVSYGAVAKQPADPIVTITGGGSTQTLSSQDLFGNGGVVLPLGVADVTIGAPAHSLTGLEGTAPTTSADGTTASAAVDFVRVSVPGKLKTPGTNPIDGPLSPLNQVLNPVLAGLDPVLSQIQAGLKSAGLDVADVRLGHMEASSTVPAGGITCGSLDNPLDESVKDVSATTVAPGNTFTYDIRIPNRGTSPITNVKVDDTYSAGLEFVSSVPAPTSKGTNTLHYELGTLAPNAFTTIVLTFKVPADAAAGTKYHNEATITGTYNGQQVTFPVSVDGPTAGPAGTGPCDLSHSTKFASNKKVKTGEDFGYFVNVLNAGGESCTGVKVADTLVDGVTFVSCTDDCTHSGQAVTWNVGTLKPGQSKVVGVVVHTVATSGSLPNTADVTADSGTPGHPSTPGPDVTDTSVVSPGAPASFDNGGDTGGPATSPQKLPKTGLSTGTGALALLLIGAGSGAVLLRRRMTTGS